MKPKLLCKLPRYAVILFLFFLLGCAVKLLSALSAPFAAAYTRTVGAALRALLGAVSSILPISIAETAILLILPMTVYFTVRLIGARRRARYFCRIAIALCSLCFYLFGSFFLLYGAGYHTPPLKERLYPEATEISDDDLLETTVYLMVQANAAAKRVTYGQDGASISPYSLRGTAKKLTAAYNAAAKDHDFIQPLFATAKPIALSAPLSYTQMAGFYTFYTGEVNINVNYPDYIVAFTTAHEMAHQRGVAREDEADFTAFLACVGSDDPYLVYCGYVNMLKSALTAMARNGDGRLADLMSYLSDDVRGEFASYARRFARYDGHFAGKVADALDGAYLRAQGVFDGTKSYGRAIELAVAYYQDGRTNRTLPDIIH
ncbi:MAG: DUF3810 domain-containing protein [Clostridia bacterium]|nr:DUF3810 domain-containing protein [Clostridia bacterium]